MLQEEGILDSTTNKNAAVMTVNDVSVYLRISRASVYRLIKKRKIPVSQIGKHFRFRKSISPVPWKNNDGLREDTY